MTKFTEAEINESVLSDYDKLVGKVVLLYEVDGYGRNGASDTVPCDPPAVARIRRYNENERDALVTRWMDDKNCDPQYAVEIMEPHPAFADFTPLTVYGMSRSTDGTVSKADFTVADEAMQAKYKDAPALPTNEVGACAPQEDQASTLGMR